jgi:DNA invertase Pin-like site-specific DNA recombinase
VGRMFLKILVSFGEYERELISERIKIKMRAQAEKGFGMVEVLISGLIKINWARDNC